MHIVPDVEADANARPAVNTRLTRQPHRPNDKFRAFCGRIIRAYARRVGDGDVEALAELVRLRVDLDRAIGDAVVGLKRFGYSWAEIADRLGITKQGAQQRWSAAVNAAEQRDAA